MSDGQTRTPLLAFEAAAPFRFRQPDCGPKAEQKGRPAERMWTSSEAFVAQVLVRDPVRYRILAERESLPCLARAAWTTTAFEGRSVLFLLPSQMLGSNVATLLFLDAFIAQRRPSKVGVFCARSASDIYLRDRRIEVFPLWLSARDKAGYDMIVDLGHLESRRDIEIWPVEMEGELLDAFGLSPTTERYPSIARPIGAKSRLSLGIAPLASSPLRSLPPSATIALAEALAPEGEVTISLNKAQRQGQLHAAAIAGKLPKGVKVVDGFPTIGDLLRAVERFDYAVYADSGPAHMTKLFAAPGTVVHSSAPGEVLQGRHRNLSLWQIPFAGPHCTAPCGLAKLRKAADGRIGCMGSLGLSLEQLPDLPGRRDAATVDRLNEQPVPCVASLAADPRPLAGFVLADLAARRRA